MFTIFWTNHGFEAIATFATLEAAAEHARAACMDATIHMGGEHVATFTVFGGLRREPGQSKSRLFRLSVQRGQR